MPRMVHVRELVEGEEFHGGNRVLPISLGKNLEGEPVVADLAKMPHLLIAGATGSGKSVCINTIITSLLYRYPPQELRMLMLDPKMVELSMYNALPHLRHPVVTNNQQAATALKWAVREMERRYQLFHANHARNITGLIKANFSCRIAFRVASKVDSRTILDQNGAETLLGNGDMLFLPPGKSEPVRIQGCFISTDETERLMSCYTARRVQLEQRVEVDIIEQMEHIAEAEKAREEGGGTSEAAGERDSLFRQAAEVCIQNQIGSTDRKSTRLNSSHGYISYAVFCFEKKKKNK